MILPLSFFEILHKTVCSIQFGTKSDTPIVSDISPKSFYAIKEIPDAINKSLYAIPYLRDAINKRFYAVPHLRDTINKIIYAIPLIQYAINKIFKLLKRITKMPSASFN